MGNYQKITVVYDLESGMPEGKPARQQEKNLSCDENYNDSSFLACLTASAGGLAQKVTLSEKNVKLEKVFKEIRRQTGYVFFYDARSIAGIKICQVSM